MVLHGLALLAIGAGDRGIVDENAEAAELLLDLRGGGRIVSLIIVVRPVHHWMSSGSAAILTRM